MSKNVEKCPFNPPGSVQLDVFIMGTIKIGVTVKVGCLTYRIILGLDPCIEQELNTVQKQLSSQITTLQV